MKKITFKDKAQYKEYLKNENNIKLPASCQIIFASEETNLKSTLKEQTGELSSTPTNTARAIRLDKALENHQKTAPAPQEVTEQQAPNIATELLKTKQTIR